MGCGLAERAGFEPAEGYEPSHAFQACDLNRSSTSPWARILAQGSRGNGAQRGPTGGIFIIAIAVPMSAETSVMLPGTIIVLFFCASCA